MIKLTNPGIAFYVKLLEQYIMVLQFRSQHWKKLPVETGKRIFEAFLVGWS